MGWAEAVHDLPEETGEVSHRLLSRIPVYTTPVYPMHVIKSHNLDKRRTRPTQKGGGRICSMMMR